MSLFQNGMTIAHIAAAKGSVGVVKELMKFNKLVVTTARNRVSSYSGLQWLGFKFSISGNKGNSINVASVREILFEFVNVM